MSLGVNTHINEIINEQLCIHMNICVYFYLYMYIYLYIYIYPGFILELKSFPGFGISQSFG